jgi:hypothetical protein
MIASTVPALAGPHVRRGPTAPHAFRSRAARQTATRPIIAHVSMAPERATEIQTALIKAGYMTGSPTGAWDSTSQAAMEKLQADNGWQTKLVPDSRAIIKLGLGPGNSSSATTPSTNESAESHSTAVENPNSNQ